MLLNLNCTSIYISKKCCDSPEFWEMKLNTLISSIFNLPSQYRKLNVTLILWPTSCDRFIRIIHLIDQPQSVIFTCATSLSNGQVQNWKTKKDIKPINFFQAALTVLRKVHVYHSLVIIHCILKLLPIRISIHIVLSSIIFRPTAIFFLHQMMKGPETA